jgi:prevent-host-death family protein
MTLMSSREFNQDTGTAKKLAEKEPLIITDRGEPSFVLLSYRQYQKLSGLKPSLSDMLSMKEDIEFEPVVLDDSFLRPAEFD